MKILKKIPFVAILLVFCTSLIVISCFSGLKNISKDGNYKFVWLTKKDWKALKKVSTKGKSTTAVVDYKTRWNIIVKIQYKQKDVEFTEEQKEKLNKILRKYE